MIRRPPRSTQSRSSAASDVYKRQVRCRAQQHGSELCGPPFGTKPPQDDWTGRAAATAGNGVGVVGLRPARTDAVWWHGDVSDSAGLLPAVQTRPYPVPGRPLVAITHVFRHIF